ncbi:hypothetical protein [Shewanella pealeana]|uniref:Uncharacterized protein n=1 Tax=Shewanella pealeana (strain ATCC 700345 / ANG-SQ1) TaxID=398579 RepID=A8H7S8_SHEPA|nr:hypothetical protein [Shewanella pealeana]ABV88615.1 conserved hypothetical protein [Shewanella pealeana ATCC 700345]
MTQIDMQEQLPITISADSGFSSSLKPLLIELEMWINFQALKADWYGDETCILAFDFTLVRSLEDKGLQAGAVAVSEKSGSAAAGKEWISGDGYAYCYDSTSLKTTAFIAVADLLEAGVGIEQAIKARLIAVANEIAKSVARGHRLLGLV